MRIMGFFALLIFLSIIPADNVSGITFDDFGSTKSIDLTSEYIGLKPSDSRASTVDEITGSYLGLDPTFEAQQLSGDIYKVKLVENIVLSALLDSLCSDVRVTSAHRIGYSEAGTEVILTNDFALKLDPTGDTSAAIGWLEDIGFDLLPSRFEGSLIMAAFNDNSNCWTVEEIIDSAEAYSGFEYFSPDMIVETQLLTSPNDYFWAGSQYYLHDSLQNLQTAYDFDLTDDTVSIHFLDYGVEDHDDFPQPFDIEGQDWSGGGPLSYMSVSDCTYHGMITTGVVYAEINNSIGIAGYNNDNFKIRVQQIFYKDDNCNGAQTAADLWIGLAIEDATMDGADIINNSWGRDQTDASGFVNAKIQAAVNAGVFVVAGSGNYEEPADSCTEIMWPASHADVFAVGGTATDGLIRHSESMCGSGLDLCGFYHAISLDLMGPAGVNSKDANAAVCDDNNDNDYACVSGTSLSAPQAAAVAGLILARRPDLKNNPEELAMILRYSADNSEASCTVDTTWDEETGYGSLDAFRALLEISRGDVNNSTDIDVDDLTWFIDYLFGGGPQPEPALEVGDVTCDCNSDISDITFLVDYLFNGGSAPSYCWKYPY